MNAALWLQKKEATELLEIAARFPEDSLTRISRLRKLTTPEHAAVIVEQLTLRKRGRNKFANADLMLFTAAGLEQSTGDQIAQYRASRFPANGPVLDACCGVGGDAAALSEDHRVIAVDLDPEAAACTHYNCRFARNTVHTLCADVTQLDLSLLALREVQAAFFDPSRRVAANSGEQRRARATDEYQPSLDWLRAVRSAIPYSAAKVSPFVPDDTLISFPGAVEFISAEGECREAVLWPPEASHVSLITLPNEAPLFTATTIDSQKVAHTLQPLKNAARIRYDEPNQFIYEPDPAIVRAHLLSTLASQIEGASALDPTSYYLTSNTRLSTPFAGRYQVYDSMPLRPQDVQKRCASLGLNISAIKTRWSSFQPEELRKKITGDKGSRVRGVVIVTKVQGRPSALICGEVERAAPASDLLTTAADACDNQG